MRVNTKAGYVAQLKAVCEDIIEHANEWMPEPDGTRSVTFSVTFAFDTLPTVTITTDKASRKVIDVFCMMLDEEEGKDDGNG